MSAYWKSILAFVSLFVTNVYTELQTGDEPWPTTASDWVRWVVTILAGTAVVYSVPNKPQPNFPQSHLPQ